MFHRLILLLAAGVTLSSAAYAAPMASPLGKIKKNRVNPSFLSADVLALRAEQHGVLDEIRDLSRKVHQMEENTTRRLELKKRISKLVQLNRKIQADIDQKNHILRKSRGMLLRHYRRPPAPGSVHSI